MEGGLSPAFKAEKEVRQVEERPLPCSESLSLARSPAGHTRPLALSCFALEPWPLKSTPSL